MGAPMSFATAFAATCASRRAADADQVGDDIDGETAGDLSRSSVSMSSDGTRVAIGAHANDGTGLNAAIGVSGSVGRGPGWRQPRRRSCE